MGSKQLVDVSDYQFEDLIDIHGFNTILKDFAETSGIANGLVAPDGTLLAGYGWQDACEKFHRIHPETNAKCISSNLKLMQHTNETGEVACSLCENGILDYSTPIIIENHTIATLFLGQLFHEAPDLEFFRRQAEYFNFDQDRYLESIKAIPVISKSQLTALMRCIVNMAEMLAQTGLANIRRVAVERDLSIHKRRTIQLEDILNSSPVAIGWSDNNTGKIEYVNHTFTDLFGYTLADIPDIKTWDQLAYPDPDYRNNVVLPWRNQLVLCKETGQKSPPLEADIQTKSGKSKHVLIHVSWVGDKRLINFSDMTEHWLTEQRLFAHDKMLAMIAGGSPLIEILTTLVKHIQDEAPDSRCSILLLDESKTHLITGACPDLPDFYNNAINGIEIGDKVGSCGTAAFRGERVIVEDIMSHEYWQPYTELAAKANLLACWSEPIFSSTHEVLGTFAIYHSTVARPTEQDLERINFAANLASVAIESDKNHKELESRAYNDFLTGLPNRRHFMEFAEKELQRALRYQDQLSILMMDIDYFKAINDNYGHKSGDKVLQHLAKIIENVLRGIDTAGRIGGEEFAILLPDTNQQQAVEAAERLRIAIANAQIQLGENNHVSYTVSIGIAALTNKMDSIDTLLSHADKGLYQAKASGRNKVAVFNP